MRYVLCAIAAVLLAGCMNEGPSVSDRVGILSQHGSHPILAGKLHGATAEQAKAELGAPLSEMQGPDGSVCMIYEIDEGLHAWIAFPPGGVTNGYGLGDSCRA